MRPSRFFGVFLVVHLAVSAAYYFLIAGQLGSASQGMGGRVGMGIFGGMLFLLTNGQSPHSTPALALMIFLNSALTAAVATGIYLAVRRVRSA